MTTTTIKVHQSNNITLLKTLVQTQARSIQCLEKQIIERVNIPTGLQLMSSNVQWSVEASLVPGLNGYDLLIFPIHCQWKVQNLDLMKNFLSAPAEVIEQWLSVWARCLDVDASLLSWTPR